MSINQLQAQKNQFESDKIISKAIAVKSFRERKYPTEKDSLAISFLKRSRFETFGSATKSKKAKSMNTGQVYKEFET